ncbi:MAG: hypothetical protein IPP79_20725 [Chitinophagaceae bacterium]|nr:hypothetical protein [Chitinophagaceae bacterium]
MNKQFINSIISELTVFLSPLFAGAEDTYVLKNKIFASLGWRIEAITNLPISDIQAIINDAIDIADSFKDWRDIDFSDVENIINFFSELAKLADKLDEIKDKLNTTGEDFSSFPKELFDSLFFEYLLLWHPTVYNIFVVLEVIPPPNKWKKIDYVTSDTNGQLVRQSSLLVEMSYDNLIDFLKNPFNKFKDIYFPDGINSRVEAINISEKLFPRLVSLFRSLNIDADYGISPLDIGRDYGSDLSNKSFQNILTLTIAQGQKINAAFGISCMISSKEDGKEGIHILPFGTYNEVWLHESWLIASSLTGSINVLTIHDGGIDIFQNTDPSFKIAAFLSRLISLNSNAAESDNKKLLIGNLLLETFLSYSQSEFDYGGYLSLRNNNFNIKSSKSDGFLSKILPQKGISSNFDIQIGWTKKKGIHFRGGVGLEYTLTKPKTFFDFLTLENFKWKLKVDSESGLNFSIGLKLIVQFQGNNLDHK